MNNNTKNAKVIVSIVIPNWNGIELLPICLSSLEQQTYKYKEVIVVDNGSTDGSIEYIRSAYPFVKTIQLPNNTGFAYAVNQGIKESKGRYTVLINNDTKVDKKCIEFLIKSIENHPDVSMVATKMLNYFNPKLIDGAGAFIDTVGHANNRGYQEQDSDKFNKSEYVFLVCAGGALFKKDMFNNLGYFDEDYFAYFEDVDFCLRAQLQGYKAWYESRAIIYHMHKTTSKRNKPFLEYLQFRNMMLTVLKDFPDFLLKNNFNWLKIMLVNLNTFRYLVTKGYILEAIKVEFYLLIHLKDLLSKRSLIQSNIKVPQSYILDNIKEKRLTFFRILKTGF